MLTSKGLDEFFHGSLIGSQRNFGYLDGTPEEAATVDRWVEIEIRNPQQVVENGVPKRSAIGEAFSRIGDEIEGELIGDFDPWGPISSRH